MTEPNKRQPLPRVVAIAAAIAFIAWGISQAQSVLGVFLVSVFLAVLTTPLVLWLGKRRVPSGLAVSLVVAGMIAILLVAGTVVGTSISSFSAAVPEYQARLQEYVTAVREFLASKGISTPDGALLEFVNPGGIMDMTVSLLVKLGSAFSGIVLVVLTVTFILLEAASFPVKLRTVLGGPHQVFPQFTLFVADMQRYVVIKSLISLATGVLVATWLAILQVDFPILWGFLAFLLNYVPSLGSAMAGVPAVLLALLQLGVWRAVLTAAGYVAINLALDYGVEKRLMGRKLGLSTLVVFLSLIFWGSLLGPVGAVLCVPLTLALKFAFESSESTRWVAVLLGPEDTQGKKARKRKRTEPAA